MQAHMGMTLEVHALNFGLGHSAADQEQFFVVIYIDL